MGYRDSSTDKSLRKWFTNDYSKKLLRSIEILEGTVRGLTPFEISIDYPIAAFAGINGAGKSTVLALACCAYHNTTEGYLPQKRQQSYYTFKDFFIQHRDEIPPQGIEIWYGFALDNQNPDDEGKTTGIRYQIRKKQREGKWNDYHTRLIKNVVFLGIERIVPHSERSQSRSYSRTFAYTAPRGWESEVREIVGSILGKQYDDFKIAERSKYSLPLVSRGGLVYSGFNMGAGESALFEIFSTLYAAGENSLIVIDEIELGLHARAQHQFINKLKESCLKLGSQIICTTHSREIFESLPDDARYYIESVSGKTKINQGISAQYAFSKMGGRDDKELEIFVEDDVAHALLQAALPANIRTRCKFTIIGSASAVCRQIASAFARKDKKPVLAIFDGDQLKSHSKNTKYCIGLCEDKSPNSTASIAWLSDRMLHLPGDTWPESWIVSLCKNYQDEVAAELNIETDEVSNILDYGLQAGKHNEFDEIARHVGLDKMRCCHALTKIAASKSKTEFDLIAEKIKSFFQ